MDKLEMHYIGAVSLLARISNRLPSFEDMELIECALHDCCELLPDRFEYWGDIHKGFHFGVKHSRDFHIDKE
jgi:hypothetical protein